MTHKSDKLPGDSKRFWWAGLVLPILMALFGAVSTAAVLRHDVVRHEKQIEALTAKTQSMETFIARVDQRLSHIERDVADIKEAVQK